eukprot:7667800-Prorocentrum_lima.AAC.1
MIANSYGQQWKLDHKLAICPLVPIAWVAGASAAVIGLIEHWGGQWPCILIFRDGYVGCSAAQWRAPF